ncbi:hypothetical protein [Nocardia sp. BMG111209]|uniref:hypothetical protein n=1 Tax=Nocardia sp. BMG111209 TaxID=1160137 RepID=UPI000380AEBE|nr:hypothetical protein [Nocardia sp. BMG111209]
MSSAFRHPLAYPVLTAGGALVACLAWTPFADPEQLAMLVTVALIVLGYTGFRLAVAFGWFRPATSGGGVRTESAECRHPATTPGLLGSPAATGERVRQQHRLTSRSWLEYSVDGRTRWLPVYFDPALVTVPAAAIESIGGTVRIGTLRVYPAGRHRDSEPAGRLIDNPGRADPDGPARAARSARPGRRLLLDAQHAVAAPFAGLLWIYVAGGGVGAYCGATVVAAAVAVWLPAIRGSDPS